MSVTGVDPARLPQPVFAAALYAALLLLQGGVSAPPRQAKLGPAIRALAATFLCLATAADLSGP